MSGKRIRRQCKRITDAAARLFDFVAAGGEFELPFGQLLRRHEYLARLCALRRTDDAAFLHFIHNAGSLCIAEPQPPLERGGRELTCIDGKLRCLENQCFVAAQLAEIVLAVLFALCSRNSLLNGIFGLFNQQ